MNTHLTAELVGEAAALYVASENGSIGSTEAELFSTEGLHGALLKQGFATIEQFLQIVRWKSGSRTLRYFAGQGVDEEVRAITRLAFSDPADGVRHRVLSLIKGVNRPTASAVLAVWRPETYTVLDFRTVRALMTFGELESLLPDADHGDPWTAMKALAYNDYLAVCRTIVDRLNTQSSAALTLRDLDRALWQLDRQTQ